jgi:hypothetical protein
MPLSLKSTTGSLQSSGPNEKRQKAVPLSVIHKVSQLYSGSKDPLSSACSQLIVGAFFFAMRSCEYSKTTSPNESTTTKLLTLRNIRFFSKSKLITHDHPNLASADIVSITFEAQKNKTKFQTISLHRSSSKLCPVQTWATIVKRIRSHPSANDFTNINAYQSSKGRLLHISSSQIRQKLRIAASLLGSKTLGFEVNEIGCHSLRSGSAMAMYLAHIPVTTIQLIGRWKSDAFLRYIREQVDCFTSNVASAMARAPSFYTIPDPGKEKLTTPKKNPSHQHPLTYKVGQDTDSLLRIFPTLVLWFTHDLILPPRCIQYGGRGKESEL